MPKQGEIIPSPRVDDIVGWDGLDWQEQAAVRREASALAHAMVDAAQSRLLIGEHLAKLQELLENGHRGTWKTLLETFHFSTATAYRYIESYRNAREWLPENIYRALVARGIDFSTPTKELPLGHLTPIIKQNPPPSTTNAKTIEGYVRKVDEAVKRSREKATRLRPQSDRESNELLRESYRFVAVRLAAVKRKKEWLMNLIGYLLSEAEIMERPRVAALELPEGYKAQVGRPRGSTKKKPN